MGLRSRKIEVCKILNLLARLAVVAGKISLKPLAFEHHSQQVLKHRLGIGLMATQLKKVHSLFYKVIIIHEKLKENNYGIAMIDIDSCEGNLMKRNLGF